ncbi:DUF4376 domain-containing protein [Pyramidobacter porci]
MTYKIHYDAATGEILERRPDDIEYPEPIGNPWVSVTDEDFARSLNSGAYIDVETLHVTVKPIAPPTLDELKASKKREITAARDAAIAAGTTWRTHAVDADEDAQRAASAQIVKSMAYQQMGRPVPDTPWRLKDGSYVTLSDADVWDLSQAIEAHVSGCYSREAALAAQIEAAETPEDLNALCWE